MDISALSKNFSVRPLNSADTEIIYQLSCENRIYYQFHPPFVTEESILEDMAALPPGKTLEDKYYIGFFDHNALVAVMDLITDYPTKKVAFIGFFMLDVQYQNRGIGSGIINEITAFLKEQNFEKIRLGVEKGNPQSRAFWLKNKFTVVSEEKYILMELEL